MKVTNQQVEKILTGNQKFSQLAFSMMVTRMKKVYVADASQTMLQTCTEEMNEFLEKFRTLMTTDYAIIEKL